MDTVGVVPKKNDLASHPDKFVKVAETGNGFSYHSAVESIPPDGFTQVNNIYLKEKDGELVLITQ